MQAAQSAAQEDGVAPPPDLQGSSLANGGGGGGGALAAQMAQQQQQQQQRKAMQAQQQQQQHQAVAAAAAAAQAHHQQEQASSSGGGGGGGGGGKKKGVPMRRGKWTTEEEAYANRLIQEFKAGLLPLTDGTTLRTFLSKLLNCDPMRISKKFVGGNCIGKQVFRRRTADLNRLTPDQIQKSRAELSELERRFLERVAQTNRVKSSGVGGNGANSGNGGGNNGSNNNNGTAMNGAATANAAALAAAAANMHHPGQFNHHAAAAAVAAQYHQLGGASADGIKSGDSLDFTGLGGMGMNLGMNMGMNASLGMGQPASPPWMQPPQGYKQGMGAQMAAANLAGGQANSRAAAAGRALLEGLKPSGGGGGRKGSSGSSTDGGKSSNGNDASTSSNAARDHAASMYAMAEFQRQASQHRMADFSASNVSTQNLMAALAGVGGSSQSLAQMAHNASVARMSALAEAGGGNSFNNLMFKSGFSRDQLSQLARDRGLSSASLSNMVERKSSFDALMSLDFQSLQSIDNLANLIQTGGPGAGGGQPSNGMKNWSADSSGGHPGSASSASLSNAAQRLASATNLESLMRSLSGHNMSRSALNAAIGGGDGNDMQNNAASNANLQALLHNMASGGQGAGSSMSSLFNSAAGNNAASAASLANLFRDNSSTGLSALRMQDGLNNRNTSVEDFLSLVAAGDIPHQDPAMLNLPLNQLQQQQAAAAAAAAGDDRGDAAAMFAQHHALAQATGNVALANALASRSFGNLASQHGSGNHLANFGSTAELLQQMASASSTSSFNNMKRKLMEVDRGLDAQGIKKR